MWPRYPKRKVIVLPATSRCIFGSSPMLEISCDGADWWREWGASPVPLSIGYRQPFESLWLVLTQWSFNNSWARGQPDDPAADICSKQIGEAYPYWDMF